MNRLDGRELFDKVRHNETYSKNATLLAQSRAILDQVDTTKTRVWGILSRDFFEHGNPCEIRAFYDFIANRFILRDFNRPFEKIAEKVDSMLRLSDGILLEYVIVERLMRNAQLNKVFGFQKGVLESDSISKADFITSYKPNGTQYRIGVQMTTFKDAGPLNHKINQVRNVAEKIDMGVNEEKYAKKQLLDTMIFIDFFGFHATSKGTNSEQLRNALGEWDNNGYTGDILDYVKSERLRNETITFCKIFPSFIETLFDIINRNIGRIESINGIANLPNGAIVKYCYNKNYKTIELKVYHKPKELLFRTNVFLNKTIMRKLNKTTFGDLLKAANY